MPITLPLKEMTLSDKIRAMEDIWANLSENEPNYSPPEWHGEVLKDRKRRLEAGEIGFTDWEVAKKEIREAVS